MPLLDKVIKEMRDYGNMGLPDGETSGGMGSQESKNPIVNAYRMNNILRRRQRAEEEEMNIDQGMRDAEMPDDEEGMDDAEMDMDMGSEEPMADEEGMDDAASEEMQQFFMDNPTPSDEEVMQYAEEHGMDMEQMRQEVYAMIQALLGTEEEPVDPVGDGSDDEIEFSAPIDDGVPDEEDLQQGM